MTTSVIVPWRGGDPVRERLWAWNRARWETTSYEIIECDDGTEPFTRGRSINRGVAQASGDRLVIADADTALSNLALDAVPVPPGMWWVMYQQQGYCALTPEATEDLLAKDPDIDLYNPRPGICREQITSRSGLLLICRSDFEKIGGFDEGFCGWGYEDDAFWHALTTLVGVERRLERWAYHLHHEHLEAERFDQPYIAWNKSVSDSYAERSGDADAMREWIALRRLFPASLEPERREPRRWQYPVV